jgi:acylphosphatase
MAAKFCGLPSSDDTETDLSMPIARSIIVTGQVQGVFFREWTVKVAHQHGVSGWVRNRADGNVEIYARGEPTQLDRFCTELQTGSPASHVEEVLVDAAELERVSGFMRRSSV